MLAFKQFLKIPNEIQAQGYHKINEYAKCNDLEIDRVDANASRFERKLKAQALSTLKELQKNKHSKGSRT
jgi:hypothetical protein